MENKTATNGSIENIKKEATNIEKQLSKLQSKNKDLESQIAILTKELSLCKDYKEIKAMLAENMKLKEELSTINRRFELAMQIIKNMVKLLIKIKRELEPELSIDEIRELYKYQLSGAEEIELYGWGRKEAIIARNEYLKSKKKVSRA